MANIAKLFTVRAQTLLQAAARQPQVAIRFSSTGKCFLYMLYSIHIFTEIKVHFIHITN